MTDTDLPEWDNHGSPVSDPTTLDIATTAVWKAEGQEPDDIAAAVLDAVHDLIYDEGYETGFAAGIVEPNYNNE